MNNNPAKIYKRGLFEQIKPYFKSREIVAIIGSRQVGKTTLLQAIFDDLSKKKRCLFLTFENRSELEIFETDIENFKKLYCENYQVIFIDEFQYAKDAGAKLKFLYDTTPVKFFITGSSSLEVKEAGKFLVGRIFSFYLNSFSFLEYLMAVDQPLLKIIKANFDIVNNILLSSDGDLEIPDPIKSQVIKNKLQSLFEEYLIFGGYPRVISASNEPEKIQVLSSIIDNYLLREIRSLLHLATENELLNLARFLSLQNANLISYAELSNLTSLSFKEIKKHLQILEQTLILKLVYPYFKNKRTELSKNPKVFFLDNGFRNKIIDNFSHLARRTDGGALAENFVFNTLRGKDLSGLHFWRSKSQAEVDFVIEKAGLVLPIEVKYSRLGNKILGKSFFSFINKYHPQKAIITTTDDFEKRLVGETTVYFVPIFYM